MNFKRPSFKRGGSTGIGQLTPRVHANMGFPNFGVRQGGDNTAYQKYLETMRANKASEQPSGIASMILGERYTDPNFQSKFMNPEAPFFSNRTGFEFMNLGAGNNDSKITRSADTPQGDVNVYDDDMEGMFSGVTGGRFVTMDDGRITDTKTGETVTEDQISIILENEKPKEKINIDESLGELSMKDSIEGEVDILKELLKGTGMSKGEKALLAAKAIGTPGTITDKLQVGADLALKEVQAQKKQDKAIILTAYKNYKASELAGGKLNDNEKKVKSYVALKRQAGDKRPQQELELEAIEIVYKPRTIETDNPNQAVAKASFLSLGGISTITKLQDEITQFEGKKIKGGPEKVTKAKEALKKLIITMQLAGMEDSIDAYGLRKYLEEDDGRVKRAIGTPETGETEVSVVDESIVTPTGTEKIEATEVTAAENVEPMQEVPVMDFSTLRNRLPKEITDDVVQLLANSKEAMQDFYYLTSQQDVSRFNGKYGVNLILPPSVLT
jgi:hypothetical protein